MTFPKPIDVIPHRDPFLFLTEVTNLSISESAEGYWQLSIDEDFFVGQFPDLPTLPGVLMCESIAQLGAYTLLSDPNLEDFYLYLEDLTMFDLDERFPLVSD